MAPLHGESAREPIPRQGYLGVGRCLAEGRPLGGERPRERVVGHEEVPELPKVAELGGEGPADPEAVEVQETEGLGAPAAAVHAAVGRGAVAEAHTLVPVADVGALLPRPEHGAARAARAGAAREAALPLEEHRPRAQRALGLDFPLAREAPGGPSQVEAVEAEVYLRGLEPLAERRRDDPREVVVLQIQLPDAGHLRPLRGDAPVQEVAAQAQVLQCSEAGICVGDCPREVVHAEVQPVERARELRGCPGGGQCAADEVTL
mmetsp:Transcript_3871/g.9224  ORF Transcript_3871/g.9224 Transcript_3871/m.9224 type:complete len:262 (-) Transcript_3871:712-1497(-)